MVISKLRAFSHFIKVEALGGVVLLCAAVIALVWANSSHYSSYAALLQTPVKGWINEYLMPIFFLLVGLEIKREFLEGELSEKSSALLPVLCAIGGMCAPAALYILIVGDHPGAMHGWAIPTATDIAFSLGVVSLFGKTIPSWLKIFLAALAIIDDLLAILVIAVFYSSALELSFSLFSLVLVSILFVINRKSVGILLPYLIIGALLIFTIHHMGSHAALAGVVTALAIPSVASDGRSPLKRLEEALHPVVSYGILPLFALFNAGVSLPSDLLNVSSVVTVACGAGLLIGKPFGVCLIGLIAKRYKLFSFPDEISSLHFIGVAFLTGIGFTMSLFIGELAFENEVLLDQVKIGVIGGSTVSALLGLLILLFANHQNRDRRFVSK